MAGRGANFQPPRNADGNVVPHDSPNIDGADTLIRYITDQYLVEDEKVVGGKRLSTGAFSESSDGGMSVDIEKKMVAAGLAVAARVLPPFVGAGRLIAAELRALQMLVGEDPLKENPHHGAVWHVRQTKRKKLLQQFVWVVKPAEIA